MVLGMSIPVSDKVQATNGTLDRSCNESVSPEVLNALFLLECSVDDQVEVHVLDNVARRIENTLETVEVSRFVDNFMMSPPGLRDLMHHWVAIKLDTLRGLVNYQTVHVEQQVGDDLFEVGRWWFK
jgi:hypothetical protein